MSIHINLIFVLIFCICLGAQEAPILSEDEVTFITTGNLSEAVQEKVREGEVTKKGSGQCRFLSDDSQEVKNIVEWSNYSDIGPTEVEKFEARMQKITAAFASIGDRRGLFAAIYKVVSTGGLEAVSSETFDDNEGARRLIIEFGKTYFDALQGHFAQGKRLKNEWRTYFKYAKDCDVHPLKVLYTGMNTHITLDLVDAIVRAQLKPSFKEDYVSLGDGLIKKVGEVIDIVVNDYGVDRTQALMFLKGVDHPWVNLSDGRNAVSDFSMKFLRERAWQDAVGQANWMEDLSRRNPWIHLMQRKVGSLRLELTEYHPQRREIRPRVKDNLEAEVKRVAKVIEPLNLSYEETFQCFTNRACREAIYKLGRETGSYKVEQMALYIWALQKYERDKVNGVNSRAQEPVQTELMTDRWNFRQKFFGALLWVVDNTSSTVDYFVEDTDSESEFADSDDDQAPRFGDLATD